MPPSMAAADDLPLHFNQLVEWGSGYTSGGYAPVHLGNVFEGRYTVIHKLGHGGFATVWLARDQKAERYVALKIIKASVTGSSEMSVLEFLQEQRSYHPGQRHVILLLDVFSITSSNGVHECLVFDFKGPSVNSLDRNNSKRQLLSTHVRTLCRQLLLAVDYIHSHKIVHADITPGNIILSLRDEIHQCSKQEILDMIGQPRTIPVKSFSGAQVPPTYPEYVVEPANLWGLASMLTADICLTDFGQAFPASEEPVRNRLGGIPAAFKAPEVWFERAQGASADLWAIGCCMYYLRFGSNLVDITGGVSIVIMDIASFLGRLPEKWASLYFDELTNAKPRSEYERNKAQGMTMGVGQWPDDPLEPEMLEPWPDSPAERPLTTVLHALPEMVQSVSQIPKARYESSEIERHQQYASIKLTDDEVKCLADLLSRLLTWDPWERASAQELLDHRWFNNDRFAGDDVAAVDTNPLLQVDIESLEPIQTSSGSSSFEEEIG